MIKNAGRPLTWRLHRRSPDSRWQPFAWLQWTSAGPPKHLFGAGGFAASTTHSFRHRLRAQGFGLKDSGLFLFYSLLGMWLQIEIDVLRRVSGLELRFGTLIDSQSGCCKL